ncbi:MAG TPA: phosphoribosylanthranilate isomerase [Geminicoccaceae bacterium]|nr:phosphoribosylanthranilate isomerase [Geminicoccus sp.]HMU50061.1 phosphoribosylanthranilate isomerase [Geminicoccaceae bacterium]
MTFKVKICGIRDAATLSAAADGGADYVGFVFYPPSPRSIDLFAAGDLARAVPDGIERVAVLVDPDDRELDGLLAHVPIDILQLHGIETPERVRGVAARTGCKVMKAVRVLDHDDLAAADAYSDAADLLMLDAKPRPGAVLPGGNGEAFDWRILDGYRPPLPWALAGGLNAGNIATAVRDAGPDIVDVSSGVESAPGVKDAARLRAFLEIAQKLRSDKTSM